MNILNKSAEKAERICTTPERMKMVESIKKSIHRSIQKINPTEYKNILKGQYIFMYLCHKGQIINSQYTKVALFMGAVVFKKLAQKITVVVTNQPSNKTVKKLALMGKPVLSVLWLQACFQEKRKVEHEGFQYQPDSNLILDDEKEEQTTFNLEPLTSLYKPIFGSIFSKFEAKYNTKFLRFVDKKQKEKLEKCGQKVIPPHEIDIGSYQLNKRKSLPNSDRVKKKNQKKKVQIKTEVKQVQNDEEVKLTLGNNSEDLESVQKKECEQKQNRQRFNKKIYEKYLKDYESLEDRIKSEHNDKILIRIQEDQTPCFGNNFDQQKFSLALDFKQNNIESKSHKTPMKASSWRSDQQQLLQTCSMKKQNQNSIKINIIHPCMSQKIEKINSKREECRLPLFKMAGNDNSSNICVINQQSKIQAILAMLSKPRIILNEKFVDKFEENPITEVTEQLMKKFQVKCKLNKGLIQGKKVVLLDSVLGSTSLTKILKECSAEVLGLSDYLFCKNNIDYVITNKKMYMKTDKQKYRVLSEANLIDELICFSSI